VKGQRDDSTHLLLQSLPRVEAPLAPKWRAAIVCAALFSILLSCIAAWHRTPWSDEGWFSSPAYNLARHGVFGTTVMESKGTRLIRIEQRTYWVMPLFLLGEATWYFIFPPTVFWTRMFSILWVPIALAAYYFLLKRLISGVTAALAVILLALSFLFIDNAAFGRPDLMCCALGLCALASYVSLRERSLTWSLVASNAFIAASLFTHPNGIFHLAGLGVLILLLDRRRLTIRAVLAAWIPYMLCLCAWALYIRADVQAFKDQMMANGTNGRWTKTWNPVSIIWNEIHQRYLVAFGLVTGGVALLKTFALLAYAGGVLGACMTPALRKQPGIRNILLLLGVYFVAMSVFNQKLSYYLIHILPLYIAVLAAWIAWCWSRWPRMRPVIGALVLGLMAVETGGVLLKSVQRSYITQQGPAIAFVRSHAGPTARIVGTAALIYGMRFDDRLRDDIYLGLKSGVVPDVIVIEPIYKETYRGWEEIRPAEMRAIKRRLSQYRHAYSRDNYDVYLLPKGM
jgi:hypothetical protein